MWVWVKEAVIGNGKKLYGSIWVGRKIYNGGIRRIQLQWKQKKLHEKEERVQNVKDAWKFVKTKIKGLRDIHMVKFKQI